MMNEKGWDPSEVDFDWSKKDTDDMLDNIIFSIESTMDELNI